MKQQTVIFLASVNQVRCLSRAYNIPCIVCAVVEKAIWLEEVLAINADRGAVLQQRPQVHQEQCNGCGICEFQCLMGAEISIRVYGRLMVRGKSMTCR